MKDLTADRHYCDECGWIMVAFFSLPDERELCAACWSAEIARKEAERVANA